MVYIPIDDEDPIDSPLLLSPPRGDCDIVEEAESHRPIGGRMVARWPGDRERGLCCAIEYQSGPGDSATCSGECRVPGGSCGDGIAIECDLLTRCGRLFDGAPVPLEVHRGMDAQDVSLLDRHCLLL